MATKTGNALSADQQGEVSSIGKANALYDSNIHILCVRACVRVCVCVCACVCVCVCAVVHNGEPCTGRGYMRVPRGPWGPEPTSQHMPPGPPKPCVRQPGAAVACEQ